VVQHVRLAELAEIISDAGRLKFLKTGCLTQRFCSTSCRMFGGRPPAWKWRERVPSARALSAFLPQPQRRQRQVAETALDGSGHPAVVIVSAGTIAYTRPSVSTLAIDGAGIRRQPCAGRNSSTSIH